ncbi:MAG TPA: DUF6622 family protein [Methylibium sp.]
MSALTVFSHTPNWVFVLLFALIALGISQAVTRQVTLRRVSLLPLSMAVLSFAGLASVFGAQASVLLPWAAAAAAAAVLVARRAPPPGTRYDAARRVFTLPGSFMPLLLILGIFCTRYAVNAVLAMQPGLAQQAEFVILVGAVYGGFSGSFLGRAARLWRLAAQSGNGALSAV